LFPPCACESRSYGCDHGALAASPFYPRPQLSTSYLLPPIQANKSVSDLWRGVFANSFITCILSSDLTFALAEDVFVGPL
jgi:hypothetical protein